MTLSSSAQRPGAHNPPNWPLYVVGRLGRGEKGGGAASFPSSLSYPSSLSRSVGTGRREPWDRGWRRSFRAGTKNKERLWRQLVFLPSQLPCAPWVNLIFAWCSEVWYSTNSVNQSNSSHGKNLAHIVIQEKICTRTISRYVKYYFGSEAWKLKEGKSYSTCICDFSFYHGLQETCLSSK